MRISEIVSPIEELAPPSLQEDYDNSGLLIGNFSTEVDSVLICLDCTEEVVEEAIAEGHGLIIAHHPIIFKGIKRFNGQTYVERVVQKAIKNDVAIYACHTNLDKVHGGVNSKICELLGLKSVHVLAPEKDQLCKIVVFVPVDHLEKVRHAMFNAGSGHIGNYDECGFSVEGTGTFRAGDDSDPFVGQKGERHEEKEYRLEMICRKDVSRAVIRSMQEAHPYEEVAYDVYPLMNSDQLRGIGMIGDLRSEMAMEEFLQHVKDTFQLKGFRYSGTCTGLIKRVAVCGGSGSSLLKNAKARGAQAFITADIKYHQFFDAESDILYIDIGHYESESSTMVLLHEFLQSNFPKFAIHLTEVNTNPVQHYY